MVFGSGRLLAGAAFALLSFVNLTAAVPSSDLLRPRQSSDACTEIYDLWHKKGETNVDADLAYQCLTLVPYDAKRSAYIARQMRLFTQIYSAQAFFYQPPTPELRITAVDLNGTFDEIEKKCTKTDGYANDYEFQTSIMKLYGSFHDGHVNYIPACATAFLFYHNYPLIALNKDGEKVPRIFYADRATGKVQKEVVEIEGKNVTEYLTERTMDLPDLAWIDHDARWNDLLLTKGPLNGITPGYFAVSSYYKGTNFSMTLVDGSKIDVKWKAMVLEEPRYQNAKEYEDLVCLDPNYTGIENSKKLRLRGRGVESERPNIRKPKLRREVPRIEARAQSHEPPIPWPKLNMSMPGFEMTVHLLDSETAVWGIYAFDGGDSSEAYFATWANFTATAIALFKEINIKHLIIDLAGNGGGIVALGIVTLRMLFPDATPFYGFDLRRSPAMDLLIEYSADSDNSHLSLNATRDINNNDFKSIQDFLGPVYKYGDYFTNIGRTDIADAIKDIGLKDPGNGTAPFTPGNIVLLSDGRCGSTCAIFGEAMSILGVKSISYGGIPDEDAGDKRMQHVGGIKGSQVWDWDTFMKYHVEQFIPNPEKYDFLPKRLPINHWSSVNLRNSYEPGSDLPLEFTWQPSNAHLYITQEMWDNREVLWAEVAAMSWDGDGNNKLPDRTTSMGSKGGKDKPGNDGEQQQDGTTDEVVVLSSLTNLGQYIAAQFPNYKWGFTFDLSEFGIK